MLLSKIVTEICYCSSGHICRGVFILQASWCCSCGCISPKRVGLVVTLTESLVLLDRVILSSLLCLMLLWNYVVIVILIQQFVHYSDWNICNRWNAFLLNFWIHFFCLVRVFIWEEHSSMQRLTILLWLNGRRNETNQWWCGRNPRVQLWWDSKQDKQLCKIQKRLQRM